MERIIEYIKKNYNPLSIIFYGSYANGTNDLNSDFDALVISYDHEQFHDTSFVNDIQLDVFVYPVSYFDGDFDCEDFVQIFDGKIIVDNGGRGKELQTKVISHLQNRPQKTKAEIAASIDWCVKMLARAKRHDAEGMFRWHWVLTDSLEIFCDIMGRTYLGPKKSLKWMEENHPIAFICYKTALEEFSVDSLESWITYIKTQMSVSDNFHLSEGCKLEKTVRRHNNMKLKTIHHIAIIVSDIQAAKDFYVHKLGFDIVRENYRDQREDWKLDLKIGDGKETIELEIFAELNPPKRVSRPEACGLRHLAFRVENISEVVAELEKRGIKCEPIRYDEYTHEKMTFFFDPDGLPLELHE